MAASLDVAELESDESILIQAAVKQLREYVAALEQAGAEVAVACSLPDDTPDAERLVSILGGRAAVERLVRTESINGD